MDNKWLSKPLENPVLAFATILTALLSVMNNLIGSLGLPVFWSDVIVSSIIGYTMVFNAEDKQPLKCIPQWGRKMTSKTVRDKTVRPLTFLTSRNIVRLFS